MENIALKYVQILKEIESYQNGEISKGMQNCGIGYKMNFGLSVTQINKIATTISKNNNLALYCWTQELRESKLLALRLMDPKTFSKSELDEILTGITNIELAEQAAFYLFIQLSDSLTFINELLSNGNDFVVYSGLLTIIRMFNVNKRTGNEAYTYFLKVLMTRSWPDKIYIKRALSSVLAKIAMINQSFRHEIIDWIDEYKNTDKDLSEHLKTEVSYFLN